MATNIVLYCFLTAVALATLTVSLFNWSRQKRRTWDEVAPHLREFDWPEARITFDHEQEERSRVLSPTYRRDQRSRLECAKEYVSRAYHNCRIVLEWGTTEWRDMIDLHLEYEPLVVEAIKALRKEAAAFRWIALMALSYMWLLSLLHFDQWRFMPVPGIAARRKVFSADILQSYERVKQAAATLARVAYAEEQTDLILAKM